MILSLLPQTQIKQLQILSVVSPNGEYLLFSIINMNNTLIISEVQNEQP